LASAKDLLKSVCAEETPDWNPSTYAGVALGVAASLAS